MKKLMIAAAIVCAAVMANAATISWAATKVYQPKTETAAEGYAAYLFQVSQTVTTTAAEKAIKDGTFATFAAGALSTASTTATGGIMKTGIGNYDASSGTVSWFTVLLDDATYAAADNYIVTATASQTFTSPTGSKPVNFGAIGTSYSWSSIKDPEPTPEPTSALLMLLGVAGLALKRKQK